MNTFQKLEALARNLWWSWNPEVLELFRRINPEVFRESSNNPVAVLGAMNSTEIEDPSLVGDIETAYDALEDYLDRPSPYDDGPRVSYLCMEYGLHESLAIYSGGLGVLAGDHAKAASDLGLPFTAVGLLLEEGYFKQHFTQDGWQLDQHPALEPSEHPLELVTESDGEPLIVTVHVGSEPLYLRAWHILLGRTMLYLLDSNVEENPPEFRDLTKRLYQGDRRTRLRQEIILGIGGVRLLRRLDVTTDVYHMNEGHCAFLTLELLKERLRAGDSPEAAEEWVRSRCVFTTHTPVMAGHDRFDPALFLDQMGTFRTELSLPEHDLLAYGRVQPHNYEEPFTMTVLGLKLSHSANGVSRLNGEVARQQWHSLYPDRSVEEVPIGHITNGIHVATWAVPIARAFLNEKLGDWKSRVDDPDFWRQIDEIPAEVLWDFRTELRAQLLQFVREYVSRQTLPMECSLDPEALTIGFARRFATYKRAPLLFSDLRRAASILGSRERPVQIIYAGKAHPADEGGKRFIQRIVEAAQHPALRGRVIFLENYNMAIGRALVSGCDLWLNNPRRPMEASGTSGQKVAVHGGLNLSILDGWWPEGYDGVNGWSIGSESATDGIDPSDQDAIDAASLYATLEHGVIPAFYERDERGIPTMWIRRMRNAMRELPPRFSARRMVREYIEQMYDVVPSRESVRAAAGQ